MIDETAHTEPEQVGFCQDCGRPLTRETVRSVGSRAFCEPCLTTRLEAGTAYGASAPPPPGGSGPTAPPPTYTEPFPPVGGNAPSPVLAAFLGLIPGVGAMYNGQFAKGIAHILIFAVLQSMARMNDFFGLLVAGWVFYQAFDAYHTARARRDGLPLPDPFGLNNIGHHVGVHFRGGTPGVPPNPNYQGTSYPGWTGYVPPQGPIVTPPPGPVADTQTQAWGSVPVPPPATPYTAPVWSAPPVAGQPAQQEWANTAAGYPVAGVPVVPMRHSRFPGAAIWLIGFGLVFLVLNIVPEWRFSIHKVFPFILMALGVGIFVRRMGFTGGVAPGSGEGDAYASRAVCSLRGPVILFTVGVLWAVQEFQLVSFHTWPVLVIVLGVMLMLERSLGHRYMPVAPVARPVDSDVNGKGI